MYQYRCNSIGVISCIWNSIRVGDIMGNIFGGLSRDTADAERYARDNRMNPAEFAPGQEVSEMDDWGFGTDEGGSGFDGGFDSGFGGGFDAGGFDAGGFDAGGFGGGFDAGGFNAPQDNGFGMNPTGNFGQQQSNSQEEAIFNAVVSGVKGTGKAVQDITKGSKGLDAIFLSEYGGLSTVVSLGVSAVGLVCSLLGKGAGVQLLVGGLLGTATGVVLTTFNIEKARLLREDPNYMSNRVIGTPEEEEQAPQENIMPQEEPMPAMDGWGSDSEGEGGWGEEEGDGDDWWGEPSSEGEEGSWDDIPLEEPEPEPVVEQVDMQSAKESLEKLDKGVYTREYLFNLFMQVLENSTPNYAEFKEIPESDNLFMEYSAVLRESATVLGTKEDAMPELLKVEESKRVVKLETTRPKNMKCDAIANEIAMQYAFDGVRKDEGVYAKADAIGTKCIITIFKTEGFLVTYKDLMNDPKVKEFVLNTKNYMPVIFGIDQLGEPVMEDLKYMESLLVQGQARVGKSWFVQFVLTQMCAYLSPKELNFFICDAKDGISDYRSFGLPHVKKFLTKDEDMVATLRWLAREEGPRRENIIGTQGGEVNIWDYKRKYPDVDIPLLYVVVDEAAALAERMEKDVKDEFQSLLFELITKTPALGIRIILIPHLVKDNIIKKNITDMVKCRISIAADAKMIEAVTGATKKEFPYDLNGKKGELAYKHTTSIPIYLKAGVLSDENYKNSELFEYLRRVWKKLEPETESEISRKLEERNNVEEFQKEVASMETAEINEDSMFADMTVDANDVTDDMFISSTGMSDDFIGFDDEDQSTSDFFNEEKTPAKEPESVDWGSSDDDFFDF